MFHGIPIIGIVGGIGSGKSFVASLFAEQGCEVIDSDAQVRTAYSDPRVLRALRQWWGDRVFKAGDEIDRRALASIVFSDQAERLRLEHLLHPLVAEMRVKQMDDALRKASPKPRAFVWDTPLLFETGLHHECDSVVFVDSPRAIRLARVAGRGWSSDELDRRENLQWPLDRKRSLSDDVIVNAGDGSDPREVDDLRSHVRDVLTRIFAKTVKGRSTGL